MLDDEELENLKKEQTDKAVEIMDFVELEEIDPIYFEKATTCRRMKAGPNHMDSFARR